MKPFFMEAIVVICLILIGITTASPTEINATTNASDEKYWITLDPVDNLSVGEIYTVSGTTNIPAGKNLTFQLYDTFYVPAGGCSYLRDQDVPVQTNTPFNTWNVTVNTSDIACLTEGSTDYVVGVHLDQRGYIPEAYQEIKVYPTGKVTVSPTTHISPETPEPSQTETTTSAATLLITTPTPTKTSLPNILPILALGILGGIPCLSFRKKY